MRVLAFDPSYNTTGFAVVETGGGLIAYGLIRLRGKCDSNRYAELMDNVETLCNTYKPERAVVEKPPSFSYRRSVSEDGRPLNVSSLIKNSNATSVILAALGRLNIRVIEAYAHRWKMCNGVNLNKEDMISLAKRTFPHIKEKKISDHEAEAICLAKLNL